MNRWEDNESRYDFEQKDEMFDKEREKRAFRQSVRRRCSVLGFSLAAFSCLHYLTGLLFLLLYCFLASHELGSMGDSIFSILNSEGFLPAVSSIFSYVFIFPVMALILRNVPRVRPVKRKMRAGKWFMFLFLALGMGYIINIAGNLLHSLLSLVTGKSPEEMTPIIDVMAHMGWLTVLYISFVAPVMEEVVFRGMVLDRLRPYGEKAAILFSAVVFGLMHGNLSQFLYATVIGIVLGYVAVKTGRLVYNILIHIAINSYTTIVVAGLLQKMAGSPLFFMAAFSLIGAVTLTIMAAALIILAVNFKKTRLKRGDYPEWIEYGDFSGAMYWNPGVAVFAAGCVLMMLFYLFIG